MNFMTHIIERGLITVTHSYTGLPAYSWACNAFISWREEIITFPLWNAAGGMAGYQRYTWNAEKKRCNQGRYFTWITEGYKPLAFWGMEYALNWEKKEWYSPSLIIVEGIFDAIRALDCGFRSCAILTSTPAKQFIQWFRMLTHNQHIIAIKDKPSEKEQKSRLDRLADVCYTCQWEKDLGDHSPNVADEWLHDTLVSYCY